MRRNGFRVREAGDGEAGLRLAMEEHPGIILLDIFLPKMDGLTMLEKLREQESGSDIPVILLTNPEDDEGLNRRIHAFHEGIFTYLAKRNLSIDELLVKVRETLGA